jgi:uncharacterized membrane protein
MTESIVRKSTARRLSEYRAALVAFAATTVFLCSIALPTISQIVNIQRIAESWTPTPAATLVAVGILLAWWATFVVVYIAETHLKANRR